MTNRIFMICLSSVLYILILVLAEEWETKQNVENLWQREQVRLFKWINNNFQTENRQQQQQNSMENCQRNGTNYIPTNFEITPNMSDLHRWMKENKWRYLRFSQKRNILEIPMKWNVEKKDRHIIHIV